MDGKAVWARHCGMCGAHAACVQPSLASDAAAWRCVVRRAYAAQAQLIGLLVTKTGYTAHHRHYYQRWL